MTRDNRSGIRLLSLAVSVVCGTVLLAGCVDPEPVLSPTPSLFPKPSSSSGLTSPPGPPSRAVPHSPPALPSPKPTAAVSDPHLPHAVSSDDGTGRQVHLHVAPVVEGGRFTSGFGWRQHPMGGGGASHLGLDIAAPSGTPVRAAASGKIVAIGRRGAFGRMIRIRHSAGLETLYAHLSRYAGHLEAGRRVRQDEVIGYVGSSGRTSGPHLHFEVRRNGRALDPLDLPPLPHGG